MGNRLVKQPNGLFARYSDIVDDFTHMNMDEVQAVRAMMDNGWTQIDAQAALERAKADLDRNNQPYNQGGLGRWNAELPIIKALHGEKGLAEVLAIDGFLIENDRV